MMIVKTSTKSVTAHVPGVHPPSGMASALEFAMEFRTWADSQDDVTADRIVKRWGVSRATAHRWRSAYEAVKERAKAKEIEL